MDFYAFLEESDTETEPPPKEKKKINLFKVLCFLNTKEK
jgi:hypothetical protein